MSEYRRAFVPGGTFFFTVVTHQRQPLLTEAWCREALHQAIAHTRETHPLDIIAWVLLPDHMHAIWRLPQGDADFSLRWSLIKQSVTRVHAARLESRQLSKSRGKRREGGLWQRRFWEHQIRDDNDLARHVEYIHYNPVKHGHVARVIDWPYSTFHRFVRSGDFPEDWAGVSALNTEGGFGE